MTAQEAVCELTLAEARRMMGTLSPVDRATLAGLLQRDTVKDKSYQGGRVTRRKFDRFLVDVEIGHNLKVCRLTPPERWAFVAGVLSIAAKAPTRGALLIGELRATVDDVARQADVSRSVAAVAYRKLLDIGMVATDENGVDWVHDFDVWNPPPKTDRTNAERQARHRTRNASNNGTDNAAVTPPVTGASRSGNAGEVEERKKEDPPNPPGGNVVMFRRRKVGTEQLDLAKALLAEFNTQASTNYGPFTGQGKPSDGLQRILGAVVDHPNLTLDEGRRIITWRLSHPFWDGAPTPGVVFGPNVFEGNRASAMMTTANGAQYSDEQLEKFL